MNPLLSKLEKVFFDKTMLIWAALPNLAFWSLALLVVMHSGPGLEDSFAAWNDLGNDLKSLLGLFIFFWLVLTSFLSAGLVIPTIRLLAGDWPNLWPIGALHRFLVKRWKKKRAVKDEKDRNLEQYESDIESLRDSFKTLSRSIGINPKQEEAPHPAPESNPTDLLDLVEEQLKNFDAEAAVKDLVEELGKIHQQLDQVRSLLAATSKENPAPNNSDQDKPKPGLRGRRKAAQAYLVARDCLSQCSADRAVIAHALLNEIPKAGSITPTRLGNLLGSAAHYPAERYGMDAALFWPRLIDAVPSERRKALEGSRTPLYLLCLTLLYTFFGGLLLLGLLVANDPTLWNWALLGLVALLPISRLLYLGVLGEIRNWTDQMRIIFDVHRFELLDHLGLQRPADPVIERRLWQALAAHLHRAYDPDPKLLRFIDPKAPKARVTDNTTPDTDPDPRHRPQD